MYVLADSIQMHEPFMTTDINLHEHLLRLVPTNTGCHISKEGRTLTWFEAGVIMLIAGLKALVTL